MLSASDAVDLDGVRILDLTRVLAGPFATQILANLGADVIKVEFPSGDPARAIGPYAGSRSLYFASVNTGKRGVVVDPRSENGRGELRDLVGWSDVVVHNFRPQAAAAMGLTPQVLLDEFPELLVVTVSGYSSTSSSANRAAFDLSIQAESGVMAVTGETGRPPMRSGAPISDLTAGLWAALAVTSGLLTTRRTGRGMHVEVPLLDATLPLLSYMATAALATEQEPEPVGSGHHRLVPYRAYPCSDGWIVIAVLSDKFWPSLCKVLGLLDLAGRGELRTVEGRLEHRGEIDRAVTAACRQWVRKDLLQSLAAESVPAAPVNSVLEALTNDYTTSQRRVVKIGAGDEEYVLVRGPFDSTDREMLPAPRLGEHTASVLGALRKDKNQST